MGRRERELSPRGGLAGRLAAELRALRREAGGPSYREMASRVYFSRSALAEAAAGRSLPSLPVLLAFVQACGGDPEPWTERWHVLRRLLDEEGAEVPPASAWPAEEPVDGADPDCAGCAADAVTAHARKVALTERRVIMGKVELRYSPRFGAAWSRFEGFASLNHVATERDVDVEVQVCREPDGVVMSFRDRYVFDLHWSDVLRTGSGPVLARANLYFDGELAAAGESDRLMLP
ncbi:helix-turn-helix domain-containing protein [Phytomonospora endophytica]|uniref:Transcriptional regulator with XRE-family HTH domain n=1 Tax=Phytomonospora endophytica TaxID=714109 RepID=A0A841FSF4_9ACTN|nr:helix-turn-helix domain-containing protein [Phytomonospora endophytica]MBB6038734.1 transcriptional regulator with XRE-family HTH domain [Phytomonospora endophytica]GIG68470.1 hypothetical protein Pen01_47650 [Phytomonospora endophytica]